MYFHNLKTSTIPLLYIFIYENLVLIYYFINLYLKTYSSFIFPYFTKLCHTTSLYLHISQTSNIQIVPHFLFYKIIISSYVIYSYLTKFYYFIFLYIKRFSCILPFYTFISTSTFPFHIFINYKLVLLVYLIAWLYLVHLRTEAEAEGISLKRGLCLCN